MKNREATEIFDLILQKNQLPAELDKLVPLSFIGQKAVTFYREKVQLMNQLSIAEEQKKATLRDGQDAGRLLLEIEARIGELLPPEKEALKTSLLGGEKARRPEGIDRNRAGRARAIYRNPEAVAEVIKEAEENEDIPTKTAVLTKIKIKKYTEQYPETTKPLPSINELANKVNSKLIDCLDKLREIWKYKDQINQITQDTIMETIDDLYQLIFEENNE